MSLSSCITLYLNPNNKFGMEINKKKSFCDVPVKRPVHIFQLQKSIIVKNLFFYQ
jgi:hypothetical protein